MFMLGQVQETLCQKYIMSGQEQITSCHDLILLGKTFLGNMLNLKIIESEKLNLPYNDF